MATRIDFLDDLNAPKLNSIVPSVNVVVVNEAGQFLLIRRIDNGNWVLPGGGMDPGESMTQAAVREVEEETGVRCEVTGLVGCTPNPNHVVLYTSNNEVRQEFSLVYMKSAGAVAVPPRQNASLLGPRMRRPGDVPPMRGIGQPRYAVER